MSDMCTDNHINSYSSADENKKDNKPIYLRSYAATIIDVIEDFLEEKGIQIENDEKHEDALDAIIYGTDFDFLSDNIVSTLKKLVDDAKDADNINTETYS